MKKPIIILIIFLILIGVGVGAWYYQNHQKVVSSCKEKCKYKIWGGGKSTYFGVSTEYQKGEAWKYYPNRFDVDPERIFETQDQCIDYCIMELTK